MRVLRGFVAAILLLAAAASAAAACTLGKIGELPVTMVGLVPTVPAKVDGVDVNLIADSGAFFSLLTPAAAARAGLHVGPIPQAGDYIQGLGGSERARLTTADNFTVFGRTFHHADFLVAAPQIGDERADGLLGGNFMSYADVEFDLANGVIRLFKPMSCGSQTYLAYWAPAGRASVAAIAPAEAPQFKIIVHVDVNGHDFKAVLDSGAGRSFISRTAARAAGVSVDDQGVKPAGMGGGIGHSNFQTWIARFQSFQIGDEVVKNALLRIGDTPMGGDAQMLLGADFLLSHRVYVANGERKLFFTYIGGPVFNLEEAQGAGSASQQTAALPPPLVPGAPTDKPSDADGYARRGAAFAARHDETAAIADFTQAITLQPANERYLYERGAARRRKGDPELALADFTAALKLKPDDEAALMARGGLRLELKDESGATADFEASERIDPDDRLRAAAAYAHALLFGQAVGELDRWIADHPKDARLGEVLNGRCWTRALWGKELDQALADCNAAIQRTPGSSAFLDSRGLVYLRLGQFERSIADYDGALRAQPRLAWSLYGRGIDKLRLGRKAEGDADIAAAVAASPGIAEQAKSYGVSP